MSKMSELDADRQQIERLTDVSPPPTFAESQRAGVPAHTPTPWRVFTTPDGRKLVGIGDQDGQGILDCGFGVWSWQDPEGVANAGLVVRAVNNHDALVSALTDTLCELTACASQLAARGLKGREGDSVSRAQKAAREALATVRGP